MIINKTYCWCILYIRVTQIKGQKTNFFSILRKAVQVQAGEKFCSFSPTYGYNPYFSRMPRFPVPLLLRLQIKTYFGNLKKKYC